MHGTFRLAREREEESRRGSLTISPLNAILDEEVARRAGWPLPALAEACLAGGARFLQIRAKQLPSGRFLEISQAIVNLARPAGATVIINDRVDVARLCHADGVHLGQEDVPPPAARNILNGQAVIGWSTHSIAQAEAALELPIDYIAVGPVFGTQTKDTGYRDVGLSTVRDVRAMLDQRQSRLPIVAIGGITLERAGDVIRAGAASVAVISDLLSTGNPGQRTREYVRALAAVFEELQ